MVALAGALPSVQSLPLPDVLVLRVIGLSVHGSKWGYFVVLVFVVILAKDVWDLSGESWASLVTLPVRRRAW